MFSSVQQFIYTQTSVHGAHYKFEIGLINQLDKIHLAGGAIVIFECLMFIVHFQEIIFYISTCRYLVMPKATEGGFFHLSASLGHTSAWQR